MENNKKTVKQRKPLKKNEKDKIKYKIGDFGIQAVDLRFLYYFLSFYMVLLRGLSHNVLMVISFPFVWSKVTCFAGRSNPWEKYFLCVDLFML